MCLHSPWGACVSKLFQHTAIIIKLDSPQVARVTGLASKFKFHKTEIMVLYRFISSLFFSCVCLYALILHSYFGLPLSGNETDRLALLELKAGITDDPFGVMTSWNESIHFCQWHGVTCGRRHQRVTVLDLHSWKLAGSISQHVGNLSFLRAVFLQNNSFSHEIPSEIGRLRRLTDLRLDNNSLTGDIPSNLSGCSQLLTLHLGYNLLVGRIPEELGTLSKLRLISFPYNNLTGSLPHSFSNLSSLEKLYAVYNNLNGSIPDIFGQLSNFYFLALDANSFSGKIPPSIFNLTSIRIFSVLRNKIHGTLPSNFGTTLPSLEYFDIGNNQFSGPIPVSLSNASNLVHLGILDNQLHGKVPSLQDMHRLERLLLGFNNLGGGGVGDLSFLCDLTNATRLQLLLLSVNNFQGMLPQCIANLSSSLVYFSVGGNNIVGSIPNGIGNLVNLELLRLSWNHFSGHIPPDVGKLQKLFEIDMDLNFFSGILPSSFGNLSLLTNLYLSNNNLQGKIPSSLSECHNLRILALDANNFSGIISGEVFGLSSSYVVLNLSQNHLTGSLPKEVGNLINLEHLDISNNMLFGEIPVSLGSCVKIEALDMQGNFFQGKIPSSLGSLRGIGELYLSQNNLSGMIPDFLERFQFLHSLNLSYNNFEGMVPTKGVFKNATATSVQGNSKLCGGIPEFQLPKCKSQQPKKAGLSTTFKLIISLVCGVLGVIFALSFLYLCCLRRKKKEQTSSDSSENFLKLSYKILLKATDGFSSSNLIGAGSFGSVYKGVLDQGETTIAVKVLNLVHHGATKSFSAECEALKNIRHRNLLKVLSACSGVDYQGNDFKALIYDFMGNGSLEEWLHPPQTIGETNERPRSLTFSQRLNIAIDVAMALDYLHHHCHMSIVHCDLKPSNVLLDDDMIGHVGDFGLVRFLPKASESLSGNQSSSVGVKGTIGYAPPEYGMGHEVWTLGDLYSYGILLLEMFTGKRPTDNMLQGTLNLHNFVKEALPQQVLEIVDPVLVQEKLEGVMSPKNSFNEDSRRVCIEIEETLISILEIGVSCSAEIPRERLDISEAVVELCQIRNKLRAVRICE